MSIGKHISLAVGPNEVDEKKWAEIADFKVIRRMVKAGTLVIAKVVPKTKPASKPKAPDIHVSRVPFDALEDDGE